MWGKVFILLFTPAFLGLPPFSFHPPSSRGLPASSPALLISLCIVLPGLILPTCKCGQATLSQSDVSGPLLLIHSILNSPICFSILSTVSTFTALPCVALGMVPWLRVTWGLQPASPYVGVFMLSLLGCCRVCPRKGPVSHL